MKTLSFLFLLMSIFQMNIAVKATPVINAEPVTFLNVAYGEYAAQRMDVYLPENRSQLETPSLILLHGGGWNSGSRHSLAAYIDSFKMRMPAYAIFNVDYRLVSSNIGFGAQESDIKAAVNFIAAHANEYKINTSKFVMVGVSAGAHLALLQAYKNQSPKIAAVIDFFGPTNLTAMYYNPWNAMIPHFMESVIGGTPENSNVYHDLSPVSFVNSITPPTIIFHGKQDYLVNVSQSQSLQQKLQQAGITNKLVVYPNAGHGWFGNTLSNSFDKIEAFLKNIII